ncbi:AMP-binding protein [Gordonia rhizosphera]|uniref:Putative fatty-acid--CoA ligase n=1 Tax=Gordonia rhizosphera NBRC 16068 TaxID=1108045 RepID=K6WLE6_9ACTN|nr:AMP-binding protein [Gordonia rhizosphera]GAB92972.1 putative fatty-acid--CoA ligase [Gordonia rhizosphera NBRC 16068]
MTILDRPWNLLRPGLTENSQRVAARFGSDTYTYRALDDASAALAAGLSAELAVGDRVALLLGNRFEYLAADLAIMRAGLVKVPLNPMLPARDIVHILGHSGSRILLVSSALTAVDEDLLTEVATQCPDLQVIDVDTERYAELVTPSRSAAEREVGPGDAAAIYYTGGTTGKPKGVVHSQSSIATNLLAHILEPEIRRDEIMLLSTALSHSAGAFAAAGLARGATLVILDKFAPEEFCSAAATFDVSWAMVVPTMLYRLLDHIEQHQVDAPALDTFVYGSAPITPSRLKEAIDVFGPIFIQLFGQTECPNWGTTLTKGDHRSAADQPTLLESAGRRSTMAEVRVIDDQGQPLPSGQVGEICLRAPYALIEYHNNPEATAATIVDGWVHTRDVGYLDDNGYLFLKDRTSDMIISGGYNVYSSEVESVIATLPGVRQVAVIGIPDPDWGEAVCAVVVHDQADKLTEDQFRGICRDALGGYKSPKSVRFVQDIPMTPFGKADKKALRAPFWAAESRAI